jgi:RNA polymerase sigma factor (sigma-70 family)
MLALAGDERLVEQVRRGNEAAFEVVFERHGPAILSYCRHMLGSREEAEDAVQHAFAAAYRQLLRDERPIKLKPWLFTIARNRCLSMLRSRCEQSLEHHEPATAGLAEQVEHRSELRELIHDLGDLPEDQRAALLLAELGDLSHAEVAQVLGCQVPKVKALVFRARSGLIERREARDEPCEAIREQLANLRGGALRRRELRHHLHACAGCREYREQVRRQRRMLAAALPVTPSLGLKAAVLGSVGFGGGSIGGGGSLLGGLAAAVSGPVSGATLAKVAVVGALVGGGAVGGEQVLNKTDPAKPGEPAAAETPAPAEDAEAATGDVPAGERAPQSNGRSGKAKRGKARKRSHRGRAAPPARLGGRARGHEKRTAGDKAKTGTGKDSAQKPAGNGRSDPATRAERPAKKPTPASPPPPLNAPSVRSPANSPRPPRTGERAQPLRKQREPSGDSTVPAG